MYITDTTKSAKDNFSREQKTHTHEKNEHEIKQKIPAIVALSHPCNKLPMAAVNATSTAPSILKKSNLLLYVEIMNPNFS